MECCFSHIRTNNIVYSRFEIKKNFPILLTKYNSPLWAYSSGADIVIKSQKGLVASQFLLLLQNSIVLTFDQSVHHLLHHDPFDSKTFFSFFFQLAHSMNSSDTSDNSIIGFFWCQTFEQTTSLSSSWKNLEVFDEILIASYHQITHWVRLSFKSAAGVIEVLHSHSYVHSVIAASGHIKILSSIYRCSVIYYQLTNNFQFLKNCNCKTCCNVDWFFYM